MAHSMSVVEWSLPIANPKVQENGIRGDRPSDKATLDLYARTRYVNLPNGRLADSTNTEQKLCIAGAAATRFQHISLLFAKVNYNLDIVYWHKNFNPNDSVPIRFYSNAGENITNAKRASFR